MAQEFYKKIYTLKEFYVALYKGVRTFPFLRKNKKNRVMDMPFIERIMLSVTEVNGCEVCTYAHTKIALEEGMNKEEIQKLLVGETEEIPSAEIKAIYFAQHYADTRGNPSTEAWKRLIETYGKEKSFGILAAIRMITVGNIYGIAFSAFRRRLKGNPVKKSSITYELTMLLSIIVFLPLALVQGILATIVRIPVID